MIELIILSDDKKRVLTDRRGNILKLKLRNLHYADSKTINNEVNNKYALVTRVLCCLDFDRDSNSGTYVLELIDNANVSCFKFDTLLKDISKKFYNKVNEYITTIDERPVWQKNGYSSELLQWSKKNLPEKVLSFDQIKINALSAVYKANCDNFSYYIKVVPEIFQTELGLTKYLEKNYPDSIPEVILIDYENRIIVTKEINGKMLYEVREIGPWKNTLNTYAKIQIKEMTNTDTLLKKGFLDRTMKKLRNHIDEITMNLEKTIGDFGNDITENEITLWNESVYKMKELTKEIENSKIKNSIDHGDFYCANIAISKDRIIIFDWSDGCVTHPFISLVPFFYECEFNEEEKESLLQTYLMNFTEFDSYKNLRKEYELIKIISELHLAWTYYRITSSLCKELKWETINSFYSCIKKTLKYFKEEEV